MSAGNSALAGAALGLVGCHFRLHGRDPATGLDCVGVVCAALENCGGKARAPVGYGLRNLSVDAWLPFAAQSGLVPASGETQSGDVLLIALGFAQHHLAIAVDGGQVVHAHAGLRRVVLQPHDPSWQIRAAWRTAPDPES